MKLKVFLAVISSLIASSASVNIKCSPEKSCNDAFKKQCCLINHNLTITSEYEQLNVLDHKNEFRGFIANGKSISYLPSGIEKCCEKIEFLMVQNCGLKDITSKNLKNYPDLIILDLSYNKIRILEADLFKSNPKIEKIYLNNNQLLAASRTVFSVLQNLKFLFLNQNECVALKYSKYQFKANEPCTLDFKIQFYGNIVKIEKIEADLEHFHNTRQANIHQEVTTMIQSVENKLNRKINAKFEELKATGTKPDAFPYIITFLLFFILLAQIIIIFHCKQPSNPTIEASKPQIIESNNVTTVSQLDDDDTPDQLPRRDNEPLEATDYYNTNESQSNAPKYNNLGYANDIYGTNIVEDLYSEEVSPNRMQNLERINEQSSLYAVVFKPQRN
ncbi:hypothetical protein ACKWTF_014165 [Chironomus riparius]